MSLSKTWSGEIVGISSGQMLTGAAAETGMRTYVALERMDVTIGGHHGTFLFWHFAAMIPSDPASTQIEIVVVPGSGTGALAGISGTLQLTVAGGEHTYDFAYHLPEKP